MSINTRCYIMLYIHLFHFVLHLVSNSFQHSSNTVILPLLEANPYLENFARGGSLARSCAGRCLSGLRLIHHLCTSWILCCADDAAEKTEKMLSLYRSNMWYFKMSAVIYTISYHIQYNYIFSYIC